MSYFEIRAHENLYTSIHRQTDREYCFQYYYHYLLISIPRRQRKSIKLSNIIIYTSKRERESEVEETNLSQGSTRQCLIQHLQIMSNRCAVLIL